MADDIVLLEIIRPAATLRQGGDTVAPIIARANLTAAIAELGPGAVLDALQDATDAVKRLSVARPE